MFDWGTIILYSLLGAGVGFAIGRVFGGLVVCFVSAAVALGTCIYTAYVTGLFYEQLEILGVIFAFIILPIIAPNFVVPFLVGVMAGCVGAALRRRAQSVAS